MKQSNAAFRNLGLVLLPILDRLWTHLQIPPQSFTVWVGEGNRAERVEVFKSIRNNTDPPMADPRILAYEIELGRPQPHSRNVYLGRSTRAGKASDSPRTESIRTGRRSVERRNLPAARKAAA